MPRDWTQGFEIIYNKFESSDLSVKFGKSKKGLARLLGISHGQTQAWEKGQWPSAEALATIAEKLGFDYKWLVTGEGEPFGECKTKSGPKPIPVLGLAACDVEGWDQVMPIAISSTLPVVSESMVAVIATGESMLPAGIAPGHICYCDPEQPPLTGDAVYLSRKDGLATIKVYIGESERGADWIKLKGWLPSNGTGLRKEYFIDLLAKEVATLAPVIYVRRRI
jgi:transcriptional regulator with XRE-family HTH domain